MILWVGGKNRGMEKSEAAIGGVERAGNRGGIDLSWPVRKLPGSGEEEEGRGLCGIINAAFMK